MDKTYKLLNQLDSAAFKVADSVWAIADDYDNAVYEYNRLSVEDDFLTGPEDDGAYLADDVNDSVNAAAEYRQDVVNKLADFDKALMKLILIRGKLAEEIGIPLGGKEWVRLETYDM